MSATPIQAADTLPVSIAGDVLRPCIDELWSRSQAARYGLTCEDLALVLHEIGSTYHWGLAKGAEPRTPQQVEFLETLKMDDLVLARACAAGNERAWEAFLSQYREMLYSAAYGIVRQDTLGRELADSLYADLYGTADHEGIRRSRLLSYSGRGSLPGWLRSVLAQRFIDHLRRTQRQVSLDEGQAESIAAPATEPPASEPDLRRIALCVRQAIANLEAPDRMLLSSYYIDGRTLLEIARVLGVHESTVSRKLDRLAGSLRKDLLKRMERMGMSRAEARESLHTDVRDFDFSLRDLLQAGATGPFPEEEGAGK